MSLLNRLWLSIGTLLLTVFLVTLTVFGLSGSASLEEQLIVKTQTTAQTMAHVLSVEAQSLGLDTIDPVTAELRLKSLTDLGEFQSVELRDPSGQLIFVSNNTPPSTHAPEWFKQFFMVQTFTASEQVMMGWNNWQLSLTPFGGAAYDELWRASQRSAAAMLAAFFVAGVLGQLILSRLLLPLGHVVTQASAIGQRRFTKIDVPKTTEFAAVARSMNELSDRVQGMLANEAEQLKNKKASSDLDDTTGLLNRDTFVDQLKTKLSRENEEALGSAALIRIQGLADMNREYGRQSIDNLLNDIGSSLRKLSSSDSYGSYCSIGRMNGADMCAFASNETNSKNLADLMQRTVRAVLANHGIDERYRVAAACIQYEYGNSIGDLFIALDGALAQSELQSGGAVVAAELNKTANDQRSTQMFWQRHLETALADNQLSINWYPVKDRQGVMLHREGMARLTVESEEYNAGQFMPWVFRLGLTLDFDKAVVKSALDALHKKEERLHVNLSAESLKDDAFANWLNSLLSDRSDDISRLGLEVSESAVLAARDQFENLVSVVTSLGCQVGIEHMGYRPEIIAELGKLGPSYLKIDSLYTQNLLANEGNRAVISSLSNVAKSLGVDCIVEGVSSLDDRDAAFEIGVRGASGPAID